MFKAVRVWWNLRRLESNHPNVRTAAAEALGKLRDRRAVEPLIQALRGGCLAAARALGKLGDPRAVEALIRELGNQDSEVRLAAAQALTWLREPTWLASIKGDCYDFSRLGASGDPRAVEPLIKALDHYRPEVRAAAAEALGELGDPRAVEPLMRALGNWRLDYLAATKALAKLGQSAVEPLIRALGSRNSDVCRAAAEALAELGDRRAVEPLIQALRVQDGLGCCAAAEALGKLGDPRAVEPLIKALEDHDPRVRTAAADALEKLGDPRAVEPLIKALKDHDPKVRAAAAEALGKLSKPRAVEALIRALGSCGSDFRREVAQRLEMLGEPKWRGMVRGDYEDFARLGASGDPRAFEPLIRALGSGDTSVPRAAAWALGELGDLRAVEPLIRALGDPYPGNSHAAAQALGKLGEPNWQVFVKGDEDDFARLGTSRDPRAVEPLIKGLGSGGRRDRCAAAKALAELASACPSALGRRWNEIRASVTAPHDDRMGGSCGGSDYHMDSGIGLSFPDPPPGLDF